jgi:hypothetical protein
MSPRSRGSLRLLVVDTCVLQGAKSRSGSLAALRSASVLQAIEDARVRNREYRLAVSPELEAEWLLHASNFAVDWLARMKRAGRIQDFETSQRFTNFFSHNVPVSWGDKASKDAHLVATAIACSGNAVISDELVARALFASVVDELGRIGAVMWVVPAETDCIAWLEAGAPARDDFTLGAYARTLETSS